MSLYSIGICSTSRVNKLWASQQSGAGKTLHFKNTLGGLWSRLEDGTKPRHSRAGGITMWAPALMLGDPVLSTADAPVYLKRIG